MVYAIVKRYSRVGPYMHIGVFLVHMLQFVVGPQEAACYLLSGHRIVCALPHLDVDC